MTETNPIFDTALIRWRLVRAADAGAADFLLTRVTSDLVERLAAVQRHFVSVGDIGSPGAHLAAALAGRIPAARVVRVAPVAARPRGAEDDALRVLHVLSDPERLPLADGSLDLAVSALALQSANDLPGALLQIRRALRPDGLFLGALIGGRTLSELRAVLTEAEAAVSGGVSPRVAPFADVRDIGGLLQRAGFALPVVDSETVTVRYDTLFALMADLRAMGATNALVGRRRQPTRRSVFLTAAALYQQRFADADGRIRATFEIISMSGWGPHESQQKPAKRGSATISLAAVLGDRTPPSGR